ncbi:hypothetical protein Tcan_18039 [Toxocara canis]|uniref:Uncharacterized protein n=1 Tax=Toxocara canis TaxID=6265 RepID=A0A0B2VKC8_TOXCA|nr:hypothetical protein Tcan_18039 [Toxocara canis]
MQGHLRAVSCKAISEPRNAKTSQHCAMQGDFTVVKGNAISGPCHSGTSQNREMRNDLGVSKLSLMASPCSPSENDDAQSSAPPSTTKANASTQQESEKTCKVGMKKEWILLERSRRSKKRRLTSIPNTTDDINKMLEEIGEGDVMVTKNALRPSACQCKCTCGFYPPDTSLTALVEPSNDQQSPQLTTANFNGILDTALTTSLASQPTERMTCLTEAEKITDARGYEWPWVDWSALRPSSIVSPSGNGAFSPMIQHFSPQSSSSFLNAGNPSQSPFMNVVSGTAFSEYETPSCSGGASMGVSNRILQQTTSAAIPTIQPNNVLVTLNQYSRIIDSTNRGSSVSIASTECLRINE